jgi:septal ring factor EnvC (AmiA/AmiB activator)
MDDCERFLAQQKPWIRAFLTHVRLQTVLRAVDKQPGAIKALQRSLEEYQAILKHCPKHLREYRAREAKLAVQAALAGVPSPKVGRPREDVLAREAAQLQQQGLSQPKIADELNRIHPHRQDRKGNRSPVTEEAVRKMLSRRRKVTPDKT